MKALIVVDCQQDFMPGGALAVPGGDEVVPIINELITNFDLVIFTKDWHPDNHSGFASQAGVQPFDTIDGNVFWPDHCVQYTPGADLHPDINFAKCKKDFYIFKKGEDVHLQGYSAFDFNDDKEKIPELVKFLNEKNITQIYIVGLAGDYCCRETAIDASVYGFDTFFIIDAIRFISDDTSKTLNLLYKSNVKIIKSKELF